MLDLQLKTLNSISRQAHINDTHTRLSVSSYSHYVVDVPDVPHHGVGTALQGPGGQGQLGAELLHVAGFRDGRQSVGAAAQQEVTEGSLNGGHVRRQEVVLNLE